MKKVSSEQKDHWRYNGKILGYPECCIEYFCKEDIKNRTDAQKQIAKLRYGFIPCPDHAQQIIEGKIKIEDLIKNRKKGLSEFPNFIFINEKQSENENSNSL